MKEKGSDRPQIGFLLLLCGWGGMGWESGVGREKFRCAEFCVSFLRPSFSPAEKTIARRSRARRADNENIVDLALTAS